MSFYPHFLAFVFLHMIKFSCGQLLTYQCAKHRNTAARIVPFKLKCAKHMFSKGSIHHLAYDEDVFTCIQSSLYDRVQPVVYGSAKNEQDDGEQVGATCQKKYDNQCIPGAAHCIGQEDHKINRQEIRILFTMCAVGHIFNF